MTIIGLAIAWVGTALAIECKEPVQHEELAAALDDAEAAYMDFDDEGFRDKVHEISGLLLPCVDDRIEPALAARYHRLLALQLLVVEDEAGAHKALEAAKLADPEFQFADALLPADHPLRVYYDGAEVSVKNRKVPEPRYGSLAFDGVNGRDRPKDTPVVAQVFDETGTATFTAYLAAREPLPPYKAIPRQRNMLIACGGGALAASTGTWLLGLKTRGGLYSDAADPTVSAEALDRKRSTANVLSVSSTLLFGVAAGCGTGAALIGER